MILKNITKFINNVIPLHFLLSQSRFRKEYRDIKNKTAQQAIPPLKSKVSTAAKNGLHIKYASMRLFTPVGISLKFASLCCRKFNSVIPRRNSNDFINVKTNRFAVCSAKYAFTMAEAVLVMTILGIIATVMITVMKPAQYKERALKIKTTKIINDIDQATDFILMNHSKDETMFHLIGEDGVEFSICNPLNKADSDRLAGLYKKYLQISRKECKGESCTCYKNANFTRDRGNLFYLKDGACVAIGTMKTVSISLFPNDITYTKLKDLCGIIDIDVNGNDEPNDYAKDKFLLRYNKFGIAWDAEISESGGNNEEEVEEGGE